jgi:hypothetical protein
MSHAEIKRLHGIGKFASTQKEFPEWYARVRHGVLQGGLQNEARFQVKPIRLAAQAQAPAAVRRENLEQVADAW